MIPLFDFQTCGDVFPLGNGIFSHNGGNGCVVWWRHDVQTLAKYHSYKTAILH